jgi:hypothetical protein
MHVAREVVRGHSLEQRAARLLRADAVRDRQRLVGRQPVQVIERLEEYRRAGDLPDRVIVQLGDNGPLWSADGQRLRRALRGVPQVVLVNVRVPRSWETEVNDELAQLVRGWPQARIADWYSASADPSLLYDEAHPNPAGQKIYARTVMQTLRQTP